MRRVIVENTGPIGTVTAEELDAINAIFVNRDVCVCGGKPAVMDSDTCNECGELTCPGCDVDGTCTKCAEETEDKVFTCTTCQTESRLADEDSIRYCFLCGVKTCPFCRVVDPKCLNTGQLNHICRTCFNRKEEPMSLKETMYEVKDNKLNKEERPGGLIIAKQVPNTNSIFGLAVKHGLVSGDAIYWAFNLYKDDDGKTKRDWLAILLDTGRGKGKFIDLKTAQGRKSMIKVTIQLVTALKKKGSWKKEYNSIVDKRKR